MPRVIRGVIFDLGHTLLRFDGDENDVYALMRSRLADHLLARGVPIERDAFMATFAAKQEEFRAQRLRDWVEVTAAYILSATLKERGLPPLDDAATAAALRAYFALSEERWSARPEAHEVVERLARDGYRLAIVSNAGDDANVQRLIDNAGLRRWFNPIVVSAAVGIRKPNPRIFEMALEAWGLPPEEVLMVGDTLGADVLGAQLTGMKSVWLSSRADQPANEAHQHTLQPDATIRSLSELPGLLQSFRV